MLNIYNFVWIDHLQRIIYYSLNSKPNKMKKEKEKSNYVSNLQCNSFQISIPLNIAGWDETLGFKPLVLLAESRQHHHIGDLAHPVNLPLE